MLRHRIEKFDDPLKFSQRLEGFTRRNIECTAHTLFRLSEKQRKTFTCEKLKDFLLGQIPLRVGIQYDGKYALYYDKEKNLVIKIIVDFKPTLISIVTFYIIDKSQLPR